MSKRTKPLKPTVVEYESTEEEELANMANGKGIANTDETEQEQEQEEDGKVEDESTQGFESDFTENDETITEKEPVTVSSSATDFGKDEGSSPIVPPDEKKGVPLVVRTVLKTKFDMPIPNDKVLLEYIPAELPVTAPKEDDSELKPIQLRMKNIALRQLDYEANELGRDKNGYMVDILLCRHTVKRKLEAYKKLSEDLQVRLEENEVTPQELAELRSIKIDFDAMVNNSKTKIVELHDALAELNLANRKIEELKIVTEKQRTQLIEQTEEMNRLREEAKQYANEKKSYVTLKEVEMREAELMQKFEADIELHKAASQKVAEVASNISKNRRWGVFNTYHTPAYFLKVYDDVIEPPKEEIASDGELVV